MVLVVHACIGLESLTLGKSLPLINCSCLGPRKMQQAMAPVLCGTLGSLFISSQYQGRATEPQAGLAPGSREGRAQST